MESHIRNSPWKLDIIEYIVCYEFLAAFSAISLSGYTTSSAPFLEKKFCLDITRSLADYIFCAELFKLACNFKTALEV